MDQVTINITEQAQAITVDVTEQTAAVLIGITEAPQNITVAVTEVAQAVTVNVTEVPQAISVNVQSISNPNDYFGVAFSSVTIVRLLGVVTQLVYDNGVELTINRNVDGTVANITSNTGKVKTINRTLGVVTSITLS